MMKFVYESAKTSAPPATMPGHGHRHHDPQEGLQPAGAEIERGLLEEAVARGEHGDQGQDHERQMHLRHADQDGPVGVEDAQGRVDDPEPEQDRVEEPAPPAEDDEPCICAHQGARQQRRDHHDSMSLRRDAATRVEISDRIPSTRQSSGRGDPEPERARTGATTAGRQDPRVVGSSVKEPATTRPRSIVRKPNSEAARQRQDQEHEQIEQRRHCRPNPAARRRAPDPARRRSGGGGRVTHGRAPSARTTPPPGLADRPRRGRRPRAMPPPAPRIASDAEGRRPAHATSIRWWRRRAGRSRACRATRAPRPAAWPCARAGRPP